MVEWFSSKMIQFLIYILYIYVYVCVCVNELIGLISSAHHLFYASVLRVKGASPHKNQSSALTNVLIIEFLKHPVCRVGGGLCLAVKCL